MTHLVNGEYLKTNEKKFLGKKLKLFKKKKKGKQKTLRTMETMDGLNRRNMTDNSVNLQICQQKSI